MTASQKPYNELLADLLTQAGLTPAQVETRSGGTVTARTVRNHLGGKHAPREAKVQQIADVLQQKRPELLARRHELLIAATRANSSLPAAPPASPGPGAPAATDLLRPTTSTAPARRRRTRRTVAAAATLVILAVGALLVLARHQAGTHESGAGGPATVTAPINGQTVDSPITATGTAPLIAGMGLWLLVRPPDGQLYLTGTKRALRPDPTGGWSQPVRLGRSERDSGVAFDLILVTAPVPGVFSDQARAKEPPGQGGWDRLPDDARPLDTVRVTLGEYHGAPHP